MSNYNLKINKNSFNNTSNLECIQLRKEPTKEDKKINSVGLKPLKLLKKYQEIPIKQTSLVLADKQNKGNIESALAAISA